MTLSKMTKWLGAVILVGYLLTLATSHFSLNTLKVGGPIYNRIALGKDLVADILPPPAYLIESYLEASLIVIAQLESGSQPERRAEIAARVERLKALRQDYETRHVFWRQQELEPSLKTALIAASYEPGERFWRVIEDSFTPALAKDDSVEVKRLYTALSQAYTEHRAAVDKTVALTNADNDRTLADAARQETLNVSVMWGVGLLVLVLIVGGAAGVLLAILAPVERIKRAMSELAVGRNDLDIPYTGRRDEIGEMARAVDVFRANAIMRGRLEADMSRTRDKELRRQGHLDSQLVAFKGAITSNVQILVGEVGDLRNTAQTLLKAAEKASMEAKSSAAACSAAAAGSQAVAAATEELDSSIREISAQAHNTSAIVGRTTEKARSTDADVTNLTDAVAKIETVVTLIQNIAQQTNLLALNATIESARAGEAGKGFAVVASEVKVLSQQTAKATEEIAQQIQTVQNTANAAAAAVRVIGTQVAEIHDLATSVAAAVEQQQAATADIARNVHLVATGNNQAAASSRVVTQVAEHTGAEARRLSSASDQLQAVSIAVSKAVQDFIEAVSVDLEDRRRATRQAVERDVVLTHDGRHFQLRAGDISPSGVRIVGAAPLQKGDAVQVDLGFVKARAKVAWTAPGGSGLQFLEPFSRADLVRAGWLNAEVNGNAEGKSKAA